MKKDPVDRLARQLKYQTSGHFHGHQPTEQRITSIKKQELVEVKVISQQVSLANIDITITVM